MKTLHIQKVKGLAGSEKYFLELLPKLNASNVHSEFVCIYEHNDQDKICHFLSLLKDQNITTHLIAYKSGWNVISVLKKLKKIILKAQPDLVHSHLIHADFWCALLVRLRQITQPVVSTKHGYDESYIAQHGFEYNSSINNRYYKIAKWSEKKIDHSFAVSVGLQKLFINSKISQPNKIDVIHHGFSLFDKDKLSASKYRFSKHQIIVVGRIIPFKGHVKLFEVLDIIKKEIPDFKLLILGNGDSELIEKLKKLAVKKNCDQNVVFLGFINTNLEQYLYHSDVMVVPSISEGFGLVFLEAMNAKIPLIGFDVAATNEIIDNEKTGVLVQPFNVNQLAKKIIYLLQNKDYRIRLSDNAYEKRKKYFGSERMVKETINFYEKVLHRNK